MALKKKTRSRWWSRLHFLVRFAGLTGLVCSGVGVALAFLKELLSWEQLSSWDFVRPLIVGEAGDVVAQVAVSLLLGGGLLALLALLLEALVILGMAAGRRSAFGFNAVAQVALAALLLAGINLYSFRHYLRFDWTRNQQFTLPAAIQSDLSHLQDKTTVVVYQRHKAFGPLNSKPDNYDYAAERKVVEKVKDLVEQFREFGPQFNVEVLDVEEEGYNEKLARVTENAKELRDAIERAPENSIFFHAGGKVQRLSFNDFYQLDKTASKVANQGRGNLVLLYQGIEPFAGKVLNIDERRPKVGVLVTHELLTTEGSEEIFTLKGVKKALSERRFDVRDVILKKWSEFGPPEAAVYTYDESRYDQLDEQLTALDADIKNLKEQLADLAKVQQEWKSNSPDELTKIYAKDLKGRKIDEALRRRQNAIWQQNEALLKAIQDQYVEDRDATAKEKATLNVDLTAEQRRMTDLKAKLDRSIADCDLLFIPRYTIRNVMTGFHISNQVHRLDETQAAAIKDFLKSGKPVFACFGPINVPPGERALPGTEGPDDVERDLSQLGIRFGKQTVLFNVESKAFAERRSNPFAAGASVEVPSLEFEGAGEGTRALLKLDVPARRSNPIGASMQIAANSLGKDNLNLRVQYPRPIFYEPAKAQQLDFEPEFLMTSAASWNEEQPFPTRERSIPRFEPPKPDDSTRGTLDEKRRGPFPIAVAVQAGLPADWYADKGARPATVRVAAIGSGNLFIGPELSPAKEALLLDTCNWLLGRDNLLPRSDQVWAYPRVALPDREHTLWKWGAWLGLPGLFTYLGLVVLMVRSLR